MQYLGYLISIWIDVPENDRDLVIATLMDASTLGCIEEDSGLRAFFPSRAAVESLTLTHPISEIREETETPESPNTGSGIEPIRVGDRFFIALPDCSQPTPQNRIRLTVDAGAAFGTGRHESTQMVLEAMERYLQPGMTVADIGCGSGILTQAAFALGASRTTACDVDPVFLEAIPQDVRQCAFVGSADAIRTASADLVLANISAKVVDWIAYDLNRIVRPNGLLLLSGFIQDRTPQSFEPYEEFHLGDWLCWVCRPQAVDLEHPPATITHTLSWY